ncbi:MAG: TetR/AcrR family transcriptional regulator [Deltaproteobacteria bacterium]|nr:TetR/AcrR family transcriptional regulator [Deltaproteobacteria bacterium]
MKVRKTLKETIDDLKKEEILEVAGRLFFERGYTKTTVSEIASVLSVGKPSIYRHFPTKTDLLDSVCNRVTAFAAGLAKVAQDSKQTPSERLTYIVKHLCLRVIDGQVYLTVLFRDVKHLPPEALEVLSANYHSFNRAIEKLLAEGVAAGEFHVPEDPVVTIHAISGVIMWLYTWYREDRELSAQEVAGQLASLTLRMVSVKR